MSRFDEVKFHIKSISWSNLILLLILVCLISFCGANYPTGEREIIKGKVISKNQTNGSHTELPFPVARVELKTGAIIDVTLPRNIYVKVGQDIQLYRQKRAISGELITYDSRINP